MPVNFTDALNEQGAFSADFVAQLPSLAGEEHKDTKMFENTPDLPSLVKSYADTKSALGKKLENVIQKPADDANDEQKAEYNTQLLSALGGNVEKAEDYALTTKPEGWPEGLPFDEKLMEDFQNFFHEKKWPVSMAQEAIAKYHEILLQRVDEQLKGEEKVFNDQVTARKAEWKGDELTKKTRTAAKAMLQFSSSERIEKIKESKLLDKPTDFEVWRNLYVAPDQVVVWANIGEAMGSDNPPSNEGGPGNEGGSDRKKALKKVYDHPTSTELTENIA